MRATRFNVFCLPFLVALLLVAMVDSGIGSAPAATFTDIAHNLTAILTAHPFEVALGTAFAIDPLDRVMTLKEWRVLRRISASTERRMRKAGLGPKLINISAGQFGVRVRDDFEWMERGGASGAAASGADEPIAKRRSGRDTRAATAASMARRAERRDTRGTRSVPHKAVGAAAATTQPSPPLQPDQPAE